MQIRHDSWNKIHPTHPWHSRRFRLRCYQEEINQNPWINRDLPEKFRLACTKASLGGSTGYELAGNALGRHIANTRAHGIPQDAWHAEIKRLVELLKQRDIQSDIAIWSWLKFHFPGCMAIIPTRRKRTFLKGIFSSHRLGVL